MAYKDKAYILLSWGIFIFLALASVLFSYYLIDQFITRSIIARILTRFDLYPHFSGEQVIAAVCAFTVGVILLRNRMKHGVDKFFPFLAKVKYLAGTFFIFVMCSIFLFPPDMSFYRQSRAAYNSTVNILVENGYCGKKHAFVPDGGTPCSGSSRAAINISEIAGGFKVVVYGVSDPKTLEQIRRVYLGIFFKTPEMKRLIVFFTPNSVVKAQGKPQDISLEMRR